MKEKLKSVSIKQILINIGVFIVVFIVSIPLVLIYAPLRYIARKLAKLIVRQKNKNNDHVNEDQEIQGFWEYLASSHPYKGENKIIRILDRKIIGEYKNAQYNRVFIYFLLPTVVTFSIFVITPFVMGIYYSFTDNTFLGTDYNMVGFANYVKIFTDYRFIYSFFRTVQYTIFSVLLINIVAFSLALLVTQKLKLKNIYRAGFFMPNLIGGLILGYIWQFIYNKAVPSIITNVGGVTSLSYKLTHILSVQPDSSVALAGLITVVIWQYAGYIMMIYIAALQNVPQDLVEASKIDGANAWQRLKAITLPLVAQAFTVSIFLTMATSFKQFDTVYALTSGAPARILPSFIAHITGVTNNYTSVKSLNLLAMDIYSTGSIERNMALAQAKAVVFFAFLLIVSIVQVTYNKKREVEL